MFYGIPRDKAKRFQEALKAMEETYQGRVFAGDMLITFERNLSFAKNPRFVEACRAAAHTPQEQSLVWRLHVLTWAASHALHVDGDFAECGVLKGLSSRVVCHYLDFANVPRTLFLYDTFAGFPQETSTAEERALFPSYATLDSAQWLAEVKKSFEPYPNVRIVKGAVPDSFAQACPEKIALLHLDMNSEKAEMLALEHLFDRVAPGGMIVLDDFGWQAHHRQNRSETEFFEERGHEVVELPTGQGLVIKH